MALARLEVSLTLVSPFLVGGDSAPTFGLDAVLSRAGSGNVVIPGTVLRGVIRDALESLCARGNGHVPGQPALTEAFIAALFGGMSGGKTGGASPASASELPERGLLAFSDLEATTPEPRAAANAAAPVATRTLTRIALEAELGSVKEGHLQVIEMPWDQGTPVAFAGTVHVAGDGDVALVKTALDNALSVVPALGASKSAGFGAIEDFKVSVATRPTSSAFEPSATAIRYRAVLEFDGPFLVASERAAPNIFKGAAIIPGGVVKGAVAHIWGVGDDASPRGRFLARTVFGEAWPESPKARPVTPPLSLCVYRSGAVVRVEDALFADEPAPYSLAGAPNAIGAFAVDWKEADARAVDRLFPKMAARPAGQKSAPAPELQTVSAAAADLERVVRTRTRMDYDTGTADQGDGEGGGLFVYDMVSPYRGRQKVDWCCNIMLDDPADAKHLKELVGLEVLIGKVPTVARIKSIVPLADLPSQRATLTRRAAIQGALRSAPFLHLLTPALLTPLDELRAANGDVEAVYLASWRRIFDLEVSLLRFYARQRLVGGWQAMRYPSRGDGYDPWVVTEPGSVFALAPPGGSADAFWTKLDEILRQGLPEQGIPAGAAWQTCPFARVNGFGEVALWNPIKFAAP